jgi:hypothetical protein
MYFSFKELPKVLWKCRDFTFVSLDLAAQGGAGAYSFPSPVIFSLPSGKETVSVLPFVLGNAPALCPQ